ncbi:MAG TPA: ABC transporter substrate-binding protein [Xanthobacteraceae bacterium]|jgi:putative ABC transport system substrate-binding protein|nr:ABC transporter substrate-binding protein [Xanthobacteraceae bacterium]
MRRRDFITLLGGAAAWPLAARAQQPAMPVVGFLGSTPAGPYAAIVAAFRQGLKETGFVEGQNLAIEYRWADNQHDRLPALAADLVSRKVAVIVTSGSVPPALAAKAATSTIPIVFHTGLDPVAAGLVSSINRPGGNITGVTFLTEASTLKRLSLLRDLVPTNVIGLLANRPEATDSVTKELETVTRPLGLALHVVYAGSERELDDAFVTLAQRNIGALLVNTGPFFRTRTEQLVGLAARYAIPAIYPGRDYALAGGLMSYAPSITEAYRQQGVYAGKILKGEKPGDLPVLQSTTFEFVINLNAARALNLTPSPGLLAIADEVIE